MTNVRSDDGGALHKTAAALLASFYQRRGAWYRSALLRVAAAVIAAVFWLPVNVHAQFATGGSGLHKSRIFWVDWGNVGDDVFAGATVTRGFNVDTPASPANRLDITCTLSNAALLAGTSGLYVYAPGTWRGDGLDDLYNIGGVNVGVDGTPNTLTSGLRTNNASTVQFDFRCSATLGGSPIALAGLAFADAEASGANEYVSATLTNGGQLRIIDSISNCGQPGTVNVIAGPPQEVQLVFNGVAHCQTNTTPALRAGPALVGFIDGASSARVAAKGRGVSAVAVGAVIELEFSEAIPASYGNATHVLTSTWSGGLATTGVDYTQKANLATFTYSGPRLGATVLPDSDANGAVGGADVDGIAKTSGPLGNGYANVAPPTARGAAYTINASCLGPGVASAWIDFNGSGVFDAAEKSANVSCPAGQSTVALTWTVPTGSNYVAQTTSHMRVRVASSAVASPSGAVVGGEVEDYRIVLPSLSVDMGVAISGLPTSAPAGSPVSATVTCTNNGLDPAAAPKCDVPVVALPAGATVSCLPNPVPDPLAAGATITCTVGFNAPASGNVTVNASTSTSSVDGVATNNTASAVVAVVPQADMQAVTTVPASVNAGQSVTVSGVCTNAGPSTAAAPTCALTGLPAGTTQSCTPNPAPNPLAVGASITCTSTFTAPASGPLNITTTAGSTTADPMPANNADTKPLTIIPQADMAAAVSGFPASANAGSTVSGTVTCTNNGPSAAATATCVPTGLPAGATVTCTPASPAASLAVGASISCAVSYTAPASGTVTVTGTAGSATADPVSGNNTAQASTTIVPQADTAAAVSGFPASANAGSTVSGTVTCTNNGPSAAATATCVPTGLPAGATVTCTPASPAASLAVGASISCAVSYTAPASGTVTVTGTAGSATADPVSGNNTAQTPTTITPQADMQAVTTVPASANAGQSVTVSGVCTNAGPSTAAASTCALTGLPAGATQSCTPNPVPNPLAVGASITCTSTFTAPGTGPLNITTTAGSTTADPVPANNANTKPLVITPQADMAAVVSGFPNDPPAGSTATGTVTCTNNGPSPAAAATCNVASTPAGATAVCSPNPVPNPLPVGASITCAVSYIVPASGGITVTGTAGSTTADPNSANNTAQAATAVVPQADMSAVTTVPASANAGQPVTVSGVCTNAGPSGAAAPTCALTGLPAGTTQSCTPNPAPNPLAVGASITCTSTFTAPASGPLNITTTAGTTTADPNTGNNSDTKPLTIIPQADMAAAVSGFPASANAGSTVAGTVTCTNNGPSAAATATCVPTGLPAGATVTCTPASPAASLAVGASISCAVSYTAPASGTVTVTGTAGSATADPVSGNNTAQAATAIVPQADMAAAVSGFPTNPPAGSTATGTVTCTNNGPSPAAAATCNVASTPAGATAVCSPNPVPNPLPVGASITCAVSYTVPASGGITVTGTAGSTTADPNTANNAAQAATSVVPQADMSAVTTVPASANAGQPVTVSGVCTNAGPSTAAAPTCALTGLPAGATQSCTPNPAPNPLAVGASITCTSTFTAPANGPLNITTTAGTTTADPNTGNNSDTKPLTIIPQADMAAAVSGFPASANAGSTVSGTVTCTNNGPSVATSATCVPSGMPAGATVTCTPASPAASLGVGSSITCSVAYTAPAIGSVTVTGTAGSATADPVSTNNTANQTTAITPQADMQAVTTVPGTVNAGQSFTVTGVCTNAGASPAAAPTCALSGLPPGATQTCTPNPAPNPLAVGAAITCTSTFAAPGSGSLNITTTAGTSTADPIVSNNTDTKPIALVPQSDMQATVSGFPPNPAAGTTVSGTVTCTNSGPSPAAGATCNVTTIPAGATVTCNPNPAPDPLPVGSNIVCDVIYAVPPSGGVTVTAAAASSNADPVPSNNAAQAVSNVVPQADLRATTTAPASVNAGQPVTVTGVCTNLGPSDATAPSCVISGLPPGVTPSCLPNPVPDPLAINTSITCTANFTAPASGPLNVSTTAGSTTNDPVPANNTDTKPIAIVPQADMAAAVSGFPANPSAGSTVTGLVTCTNNGPSLAENAACAVTGLPAGATVICNPASPTAVLAVGVSITCNVSYVAPAGGGTNTITGTASASTADPVPSNNVATANSSVVLQADMQGVISGLPATPLAGSTVNATLTCTNAGPSVASNATCTPSGLPLGATVNCTPASPAASLVVGASISCAVSFTAPPTGSVNVVVTAGSATADPIPGNNISSQSLTVIPVADMAARVSGFPANAPAGALVNGTLTCTNNGPSPAVTPTCVVSSAPAGTDVRCTPDPTPATLAVGAAITCAVSYPVSSSGAVNILGTAGSLTFDTNASNNTATVNTGAIDAVNDTAPAPIVGATGGTAIANVLANDTLNGVIVTLNTVTLSQTATPTDNPNVTLDPATGAVKVAPGTPAGPYRVTYQICTKTTPAACDTAIATVTVDKAPIAAVNDPQLVVGPTGASTNVLTNDTLNGAPVKAADVKITLENSGGLAGVTIDDKGNLVIPPNAPPGNYTVTYKICEKLNPDNCSTATVPVVVQGFLSGSVWMDNGSGGRGAGDRQRSAGEPGLEGWIAEVVYPPGDPKAGQIATLADGKPATALTDANGQYRIGGLPPGNYQVRFRAPSGSAQAGAMYGSPANGETGNPQAGSTVNTASRTLDITMPAGAGLAQQGLPVDPSGVLYDSVTRQPVTNATVTLIGPNGQPVPDNLLLPGQQGQTVVATGPAAGTYRFDLASTAPAGTYTLRVSPSAAYIAPSALIAPLATGTPGVGTLCPGAGAGATCAVQAQSGPPAVGANTNYYLSFNINPASSPDIVHNHIPLDPAVKPLIAIIKTADKSEAEIGDPVKYTIRVKNLSTNSPVPDIKVIDTLPLGFKLVAGTVRKAVNTPPTPLPDPQGAPGAVLTFNVGTLAANAETTFTYYVRIGVGGADGDGINKAYAQSGAVRSLTAQAKVKVRGGVLGADACIVGKIFVDCGADSVGYGNGNGIQDKGEPGIPGVRLYLEDGTYVISDSEGKYSLCGVSPRTHVLQVDQTTLPLGSRLGVTGNRNAGDPSSLFVDVKNGQMQQADFRDMSCNASVFDEAKRRRESTPKEGEEDVNRPNEQGIGQPGSGLGLPTDKPENTTGATPANSQYPQGGAK